MNYLIIDLELTGDDPGWHDIVRVAGILCKSDWSVISEFDSLIYPKSEDAFKLVPDRNPLVDIKELQDAPMMYDVLNNFEEWIIKSMGLRSDPISNAENLSNVILGGFEFVNDYSFLRMAYGDENHDWHFPHQMFDLSTLAHFSLPILKDQKSPVHQGLSLRALAGRLKIEVDEDDYRSPNVIQADLTRRCFKKIEKLLKQSEGA